MDRSPMKFAQMAETYGPVFSFRRGSGIVCIINGYKVSAPREE